MRTLGYLSIAFLLLVVTALLVHWAWWRFDTRELAAYLSGRIEGARPSNAYYQAGDDWLEFRLAGNGSSVHVVTNASVHRASAGDRETRWWYAFEYQLLDSDGRLLREGTYHHRTHVTRYRETDTGRSEARAFLLDPQRVPTDGRRMVIPVSEAGHPARLRLRASHADPALQDVMFRIYERETLASHKLDYRWQRLSHTRKQELARGSVYGPEHLRDGERQNLLRKRWRPLGPAGIRGSDFLARKIYLQQELAGEPEDDPVLPHGLFVDAGINGIIPLPPGGGRIRLEWAAAETAVQADGDAQVVVHWFGRTLGERAQHRVALAGPEPWLETDFEEGLLEVASDRALTVRAFRDNNGVPEDITPEALRLRAYTPDAALPVVFRVDHVSGLPTPFRIDVRGVVSPDDTPATVRFETLDAGGVRLSSGELYQDPAASRHDRLDRIEPATWLTEPARNYFNLPPRVAEVRVYTTGSSLVSAYTRPPDLVRQERYPEDLDLTQQDGARQPAWFVLRPANEQALLENLRTRHLVLQPRPPADDPRLLAGHFSWEDYQPDGQWQGRHLLIPRDAGLPLRDLSRGAVYAELQPNREQPVRLRTVTGHRELRPTLIYQRERELPERVSILLDGEPWHETSIIGRRGQLLLPSLTAGKHRIRLESHAGTQWYMNYLDTAEPGHVRRLVIQVGESGLEFIYPKRSAEREVLTAQVYQQAGERVRLQVEIEHATTPQLQPLTDWTFLKRLYDLQAVDAQVVPVLNTETKTLDGGRRFFLSLGADLPPGDYRIRIRPEREQATHLALYRLIPGQQLVRVFLRESGHVD